MGAKLLPTKIFNKRHTKLLLWLILIDLVATVIWFYFFNIPELNPILEGPINNSIGQFVLTKLALSLPSVYILNKFIQNVLSQVGLALLLTSYVGVSIIHYFILIKLIIGA